MKYEAQLTFNAQSEWTDYYIAYSSLKSAVYKAEKEALQGRVGSSATADEEQGGLLANADGVNPDTTSSEVLSNKFRTLCDAELSKIEGFYKDKEKELLDQLEAIKEEVEQVEEEGNFGELDDGESGDEESGESGDENDGLVKRGQKLIRSVVSGTSKKRDSSDEERGGPSTFLGRRRSSISRPRKRSHGQGSDASEGGSSNFDVLRRTPSAATAELPAEAVQDIDDQLERTMQAATNGSAANPSLMRTTSNAQDPVSPYSGAGSKRRLRASSFSGGAGASSNNDIWSSNSRHAIDMRITFKLRLQSLFRDLSQLKEYVSLNQSECVGSLCLECQQYLRRLHL